MPRETVRVFITGGTGFFGKSMLDYRLYHPEWRWARAKWVILSRDPEKFVATHPQLANQDGISFISGAPGVVSSLEHAANKAAKVNK